MTAALENTKQLREYTYLALFLFLDSVYYFDDSQEMFLTRPGNGHYFSCCTISPIPLFNRVMTMFIFDYKDLKSLMIFCKIVARNQLFSIFSGFSNFGSCSQAKLPHNCTYFPIYGKYCSSILGNNDLAKNFTFVAKRNCSGFLLLLKESRKNEYSR